MLTFQEIIYNLQNFWIKNGCILSQPYDVEMGAATFHPQTTLKSLGPDSWRTVLFNHVDDLVTGGTEITLIDYNIIFKCRLS